MKKIKKAIISLSTLILCFTLSACGNKYVSKYSATLLVRTNTSSKASVSFDTFSGTYVMKFQNKGADAFITYDATLGEGDIKVYYDFNDEKLSLFEIETGGSKTGKTDTFTGIKTIYIIVEAEAKCNEGSFSFTLEEYSK